MHLFSGFTFMRSKRISINNKYFIVIRRKDGTIKSTRRWQQPKAAKEKIRAARFLAINNRWRKLQGDYIRLSRKPKTLTKEKQTRLISRSKALEIKKVKTTSFRSKKFIVNGGKSDDFINHKGQRVQRRVFTRPVARKSGFIDVQFTFFKQGKESVTMWGRSTRGQININRRKFINEAYRHALARLPFSPDGVKIERIEYTYYKFSKRKK